ncbi:MAG: fibronectin type III domain-containing protein, partial [Calditrichaceae bacterium]
PYLGYLSWDGPSRIIVYSTIVLGDAEMPVWTEMPKSMVIEQQIIDNENEHFLDVTVINKNDSSAIQNALVTLYRKYEIYELNKADVLGHVRFDLNNYNPGEVLITVVKHNYIPFENTINIISHPTAKIRIKKATFTEIEGVENQQCEPGERLNLNLEIENTGNLSVSAGMQIQFSGEDSLIQLDTMAIELADSLVSGQSVLLPAIGFDVLESIAADTTLISKVKFTSEDKYLGEKYIEYAVQLPKLVPTDPDIVTLHTESGYESTVFIELDNMGLGGAREVTGELHSFQDGVQLMDSSFSYGNIDSKSLTDVGASFRLKHSIPSDSLLLNLKMIDYYGKTWNYSIDFNNPHPPQKFSFKPSGPESIELNWFPSPSNDIIGYNLFRKIQGDVDFHLVNKALISSAGFFADNSIENGKVY